MFRLQSSPFFLSQPANDAVAREATGIAEVMGTNPVGASDFFLGFLRNCLIYFTTAKITFTCNIHVLALDTCRMWRSSSHLRAFVVSYAIHLRVYQSQREVERTDLASQTHNSRTPLIPLKRDFARTRARDRNTARANQSASQDGRLATNQYLKSADLRHGRKK